MYDETLSFFSFHFHLRRYSKAAEPPAPAPAPTPGARKKTAASPASSAWGKMTAAAASPSSAAWGQNKAGNLLMQYARHPRHQLNISPL